jgi:hypothetical protein
VIWVPVASTYRTVVQLLLPAERLELAREATSGVDGLARGAETSASAWVGAGGALCALALTAWEELVLSEHHTDEARRGIGHVAQQQYRVVQGQGSRCWARPAWWGSSVHDEHVALLAAREPVYESIVAAWRADSSFRPERRANSEDARA